VPVPRLDPETLPHPGSATLALRLTPPGERAIRAGHPWVFDTSVRSASADGAPGDVAVVFDRKNRFLAVGLYEPEGPIRVRVLRREAPARVGPELFRELLSDAVGRRGGLEVRSDTTGYRLVHGESDGLPGLVLDRYGDAGVLEIHSPAWIPWLRALLPVVQAVARPRALVGLVSRRLAAHPLCPEPLRGGCLLLGEGEAEALPFLESGLRFEAHPFEGQKTGFYLDQRENRRRVGALSGGLSVLNVFSYTGGFSLYAARGGARDTTSVDRSGPALAQAERHFELNRDQVAGARHSTVRGDAFEVMEGMGGEGRRFGLVVVDPPSFAREARQEERALRAYGALTRLALEVLAPGGILVQASCSSRVPPAAFFARIHEAARARGRALEEMERTGHPPDHPVGFPEAAYLKCLFARAG
jgi:23S rRNA (cytosine1962-C5)-methyltransferase